MLELLLVRLDSSNLEIVTDLKEWPRAVRRASINSFGYGGELFIHLHHLKVPQ